MKYYISDPHIEILMKKYGDPIPNEINYVVILNDAKEFGEQKGDKKEVHSMEKLVDKKFTPSLSTANNFYTYQTHFTNLDFNIKDIIDKIKHTVKINRIRLNEFFEDFDPLRKGVCTKAKFRTALDMANLHLRSEEFDVLEDFYSVRDNEEDKVYYKDLIEEVDTVFTIKGLEKDPLLRPKDYITPDFLNPEKRLTEEETKFLDKTLKKLALLSIKYRVMPKSFFRDNDRANIGVIPSSKFASVLSFFKLNADEKEMNILIKRFYSKNMIEINYYDFDYVLKKYIQMAEIEKEKENTPQ